MLEGAIYTTRPRRPNAIAVKKAFHLRPLFALACGKGDQMGNLTRRSVGNYRRSSIFAGENNY